MWASVEDDAYITIVVSKNKEPRELTVKDVNRVLDLVKEIKARDLPKILHHVDAIINGRGFLKKILDSYIDTVKGRIVDEDGEKVSLGDILNAINWNPREPFDIVVLKLVAVAMELEKLYCELLVAQAVLEGHPEEELWNRVFFSLLLSRFPHTHNLRHRLIKTSYKLKELHSTCRKTHNRESWVGLHLGYWELYCYFSIYREGLGARVEGFEIRRSVVAVAKICGEDAEKSMV